MKKKSAKPSAATATRVKQLALAKKGRWVSQGHLDSLTNQLREATETLDAIRNGEVDAVVVHGERGDKIYSLSGADLPYRVYVERMQEGAVTISADGLILYANQKFAEMVGHSLENVISANALTFLEAAAWKGLCGVFATKEGVVKCESTLHRADQSFLSVNLTASHLPIEEQEVLCLVVTDLSSQRQNAELRLAKEVAEKANLAKDAFLAALSHELRTPLNPALLLASAAVENRELPPKVRADFAAIRNNIELEARLIDDLLDLTRIAHGKLLLEVNVVDGNAVLQHAVDTIRNEVDRKKISLRLTLDKKPCWVKADVVRLQQVFWNVLRNSVKFTPEHGLISVTTQADSRAKQFGVTISDTGIGMTPEETQYVFETFSQGEHTKNHRSHQFGGLGLGLSISKKLIDLHAGQIEAQSEGRGRGAAFTIQLPLAEAPVQPSEPLSPKAVVAPVTIPGMSINILLVEDHEPTRSALTRLLLNRSHHVTAAGSADEARRLVKEGHFHLIISDIGLPDGNGYDLMKEFNSRYNLKGIALTGYGMEKDVRSSQESGFLRHLTKPVRIQLLEEALASVVARSVSPSRPS
jgi:PAS domain S-box-containing protein